MRSDRRRVHRQLSRPKSKGKPISAASTDAKATITHTSLDPSESGHAEQLLRTNNDPRMRPSQSLANVSRLSRT